MPPRCSFFLSLRCPCKPPPPQLVLHSLQIMKRRHPRSTTTDPPCPPPLRPPLTAEDDVIVPKLPVQAADNWPLTKLLSLPTDLIHICIVSILSPIMSLLSVASQSYHKAEETKETVESAVHAATDQVPSDVIGGGTALVKKVGLGLTGAAYVCVMLMVAMAVAAAVGVGLVRWWVEEPVFVRDRMYFDYTEAHPKAVFWFGGGDKANIGMKNNMGIPVGHTFQVSLVLLMPESYFNRDIGVFQLSAEVLSGNMNVIAKASKPCMLRYRSLPIRIARTFVKGIPIMLGISSETQTTSIQMLRHKEGQPRTEAIRVTLIPRAGASYNIPQLYEAEVVISSQLPWRKQVVHNWKWTFYVWTSLYVYTMFLLAMVCCFRSILFPTTTTMQPGDNERNVRVGVTPRREVRGRESEGEGSELLRKWRQSRNKRKAMHRQEGLAPSMSTSSGVTVAREGVEDEVGDSESGT